MKDTSLALGPHFDEFVISQVSVGKYKNVTEVLLAGLRLLENEERRVLELRAAIETGLDSELVEDFDFEDNLQRLKSEKKLKNG